MARGALRTATLAAPLAVASWASVPASAQPAHHAGSPYAAACLPVAERAGREAGCWITATEAPGELPPATPLHWHLGAYQSHAAALAAKGARGTVVESLGRVWLFTVAEAGWRPSPGGGGERVAAVGPLPTREGVRYVARYMEGVRSPAASGIAAPSSAPAPVHARPPPRCGFEAASEGESGADKVSR